jgi:hypothetical protein
VSSEYGGFNVSLLSKSLLTNVLYDEPLIISIIIIIIIIFIIIIIICYKWWISDCIRHVSLWHSICHFLYGKVIILPGLSYVDNVIDIVFSYMQIGLYKFRLTIYVRLIIYDSINNSHGPYVLRIKH